MSLSLSLKYKETFKELPKDVLVKFKVASEANAKLELVPNLYTFVKVRTECYCISLLIWSTKHNNLLLILACYVYGHKINTSKNLKTSH